MGIRTDLARRNRRMSRRVPGPMRTVAPRGVWLAGLLLAGLAGCTQQLAYAPPGRPPSNTIIGRTAITRTDGSLATCAGDAATPLRVTPASRARMDELYVAGENYVLISGQMPARSRWVERQVMHEYCDGTGG